jgi:hypothetical protein
VRRILAATPFDLVDLFFDLEGLQVVELRLVRLELGVELVLAGLLLREVLDVVAQSFFQSKVRTVSFLSKRTTRPPLSPVAR